MGIKQLYNDNLRKLPNEDGNVSVMLNLDLYVFCFAALMGWMSFMRTEYFVYL